MENSLYESNRFVNSTVGPTNCQRMVHKGTPQGGVLSPLLWNLANNPLLRGLEHSGNGAIAYADDIAIAALEICSQTLELNLAQSIVLNCLLNVSAYVKVMSRITNSCEKRIMKE